MKTKGGLKFFRNEGITLVELLIYAGIIGLFALVVGNFFSLAVKSQKTTELQATSFADLRNIMIQTDRDLGEANEFRAVSPTTVEFICDIVKNHDFKPNEDDDGDGIPNMQDPDLDGDAAAKFNLDFASQWKAGYNMEDDDDDNDGRIDVRIKIYFDSARGGVYRGISINEGTFIETVLGKVTNLKFTFFGSRREDLGKLIDFNNDGLITEDEIDQAPPNIRPGFGDASIDTQQERDYINLVRVYLEKDKNQNGVVDARLTSEISTFLVQLKAASK